MKRVQVIAATLVSAAALVSCSTPTDAPQGDQAKTGGVDVGQVDAFPQIQPDPEVEALLPAGMKASKKITIVVTAGAPPTSFISPDGKTSMGLNADIGRALARTMGVEPTLVSIPLDGIIPGLQSKKYDMALASMSPSPERLQVLDMVAFTKGGSAVAVPTGNPKGLSSKALCGLQVGVAVGSFQATTRLPKLSEETCTGNGKPAIKAVELPDQSQVLLAMSSGRVDAAMADGPVLGYAQKTQNTKFEVLQDESSLTSTGGMAVVKGSELTPLLVKAMEVLHGLPEYQKIYEKWGMAGYALPAAELGRLKG
ncbi:transporter substrate-binding domain-containing protein [Streptosporangium sp. NBC_01756]|uniref:transporter substrate-binding domain-containing protein n=1 Tax=Streptosporangium sp. NBC_01756 TaxID=2975950 RepID=UPI002DD94697|nr:transporter substrate-binding domain-containing protein [Streptosporangium sp. NBC_01756]WSC89932.1 transporter substrate-binding domain-containing protein [Streptosporangium sp. NBC_01756]